MGALLVVAVKVRGDVRGIAHLDRDQLRHHLRVRRLISWQGHLGGFVGGVLLGRRDRLRPAAAPCVLAGAGIGAVAVLVVVATVVRIALLA